MIQIVLTPIETGSKPVAFEWKSDDVWHALWLTESKLWCDFQIATHKEKLIIRRLITRLANERFRRQNLTAEVVDLPDVAMIGLGIVHYEN